MSDDFFSLVAFGSRFLSFNGVPFPEREAKNLLLFLLKESCERLFFNETINEDTKKAFYDLLEKRSRRFPIVYLEQEISFYNVHLHISEGVLIPRQETEILVDMICRFLKNQGDLSDKVFWDVCCGSGCVGLAVKKTFPRLHVILSDISDAAVAITKRNAESNDLRVEVLQGNLFEPFGEASCHYFCCNPPYISFREIIHVDPEVRCFEPWTALVAGSEGTEFYSRIAEHLDEKLDKDGVAWMEIGYDQADAVNKIFEHYNRKKKLFKDFSNQDRFFFLEADRKDVYPR